MVGRHVECPFERRDLKPWGRDGHEERGDANGIPCLARRPGKDKTMSSVLLQVSYCSRLQLAFSHMHPRDPHFPAVDAPACDGILSSSGSTSRHVCCVAAMIRLRQSKCEAPSTVQSSFDKLIFLLCVFSAWSLAVRACPEMTRGAGRTHCPEFLDHEHIGEVPNYTTYRD